MIRIDVQVVNEEALVRLDQLPRRLRVLLEAKMEAFLDGPARERLLSEIPGKFLDPKYVHSDVSTVGSLLIGTLEAEDKPGFYGFGPSKARALRFVSKSSEIVFTKRVELHPFPKGRPIVERYFREHKPWLIGEVEDFIFDAVYNAR